ADDAAALGRPVAEARARTRVVGSTGMGNVSHVVPSIHQVVAVAPRGVSIDWQAFASHAASPAGDIAVVLGAKAMAMTIADLWADRTLLERARAVHQPSAPRP